MYKFTLFVKFEYEGIIKKKKKRQKNVRGVFVHLFFSQEMDPRIPVRLLLNLTVTRNGCWGRVLGRLGCGV